MLCADPIRPDWACIARTGAVAARVPNPWPPRAHAIEHTACR